MSSITARRMARAYLLCIEATSATEEGVSRASDAKAPIIHVVCHPADCDGTRVSSELLCRATADSHPHNTLFSNETEAAPQVSLGSSGKAATEMT